MSSHNYHPGVGRNIDFKGSVDSGFQEPIEPLCPHDPSMEINNHYLNRKDIPQASPLGSPVLERRDFTSMNAAELFEQHQLQLASLKQQQDLQQQLLFQQYQQQQQRMMQDHEKQIQEHLKQMLLHQKQQEYLEQQNTYQMVLLQKQQEYLEQQQKLEERQRMEKELLEKEKLTQLKNKKKDEESAVASSAVKQKLQEFVLTKKQREAIARNSPTQFRNWSCYWPVNQSSPPQPGLSPPYRQALLGKYDEDFPLRKTASEPNLKVRSVLKQKIMGSRNTHSPILRRRDKTAYLLKRKTQLSIDGGSNSDSGPNSPPSGVHSNLPNGSLTALHPKEDSGIHPYNALYRSMGYPSPDLYTSPSMPNISLGRPPTSGPPSSSSTYSEAELRALGSARLGNLPLPPHLMGGSLPMYQPSLPVIDGDFPMSSGASHLPAHISALEEARGKLGTSPLVGPAYPGVPTSSQPPTEGQQARIHRHRPLGRTQSAPLPIGHPYLQQQGIFLQQQQQQQQQQEQILKDKLLVKQHIRQAVLQRTSSKTHMENVDEETEAKLAQEMRESQDVEEVDVIEVKESKMDEAQSASEKLSEDPESFKSAKLRDGVKPRHKGPSNHRPLARTHSSPLVTFKLAAQAQETGPVKYPFTTGVAYESVMLKHQCSCLNNSVHPEHAGRLQSIWAHLQAQDLISKCAHLSCRKASIEEIKSCHSEAYSLLYGTDQFYRQKLDPKLFENLPTRFCILPCGGVGVDSDTVWDDFHTSTAARTASGCVIELSMRVAKGELKNGFALVRPPGHHAEYQQAMGFCYFNSIAIAAKQVREKLKLNKILIVDWDVHHGNGTQQMFYEDNHVLYISIHRHDNGNFFPGTGDPEECGEGDGLGFNVNIAFSGGLSPAKGDAEYLAAFRTIVMPIAREFAPELVLVSAGFDAALGHPAPLGGYEVTPACFGHMTRELMSLAGGKIVLVLEGGYELTSICDATEMCVRALLGEEIPPISDEELSRVPCGSALETLESAINVQTKYWPCVERYLRTVRLPLMEAQKREVEEADTVTALASLSMVTAKRSNSTAQESEPMEEES